jgi:hypothetical protein
VSKQADLIERVLNGDTQYPAARVQAGELTWFIGQETSGGTLS